MVKVLLVGGNGRMGRSIRSLIDGCVDIEVTAIVDLTISDDSKIESKRSIGEISSQYDIIVDFTPANSMIDNLKFAIDNGKGFVTGSTGLSDDELQLLNKSGEKGRIFYASNFSTGVYILNRLAKEATRLTGGGFDIEVVEMHHRDKVDAPSGTAKTLLESIYSEREGLVEKHGRYGNDEKRDCNEIGVHTLRGGDVIGDHKVIFSGSGENIEISHRAVTRDLFSNGVIKAIRFMGSITDNGLYGMDHLFGSNS